MNPYVISQVKQHLVRGVVFYCACLVLNKDEDLLLLLYCDLVLLIIFVISLFLSRHSISFTQENLASNCNTFHTVQVRPNSSHIPVCVDCRIAYFCAAVGLRKWLFPSQPQASSPGMRVARRFVLPNPSRMRQVST